MPGYARPTTTILATEIINIPYGTISSTTAQGAINELDDEKATTGSVSAVSASVQSTSTKVLDVYASASARSSALPSPTEGKLTYLTDQKTIQVYNGTAWVAISGGGSDINPLSVSGM